MRRFHVHLEESAITQLQQIAKATGRSTAHWVRQAIDDLVVRMVELGVINASAPLRAQRREPWEREIREELLARKELEQKLGPRDDPDPTMTNDQLFAIVDNQMATREMRLTALAILEGRGVVQVVRGLEVLDLR